MSKKRELREVFYLCFIFVAWRVPAWLAHLASFNGPQSVSFIGAMLAHPISVLSVVCSSLRFCSFLLLNLKACKELNRIVVVVHPAQQCIETKRKQTMSEVPPTRMNQQVFKAKLKAANGGHKLLKKKADALKVCLCVQTLWVFARARIFELFRLF